VPKRKLAIGALVAAVVLGVAAAVAIPAIDTGKEKGAAQRRAQAQALERAEARRLRIDQAPHRGADRSLPAGLSLAARRRALEADLRSAITADTRARARAGKIDGPIAYTSCSRAEIGGEEHLAAVLGRYRCLAINKTVRSVPGNTFQTGYPFVATIHYRSGTYVWCKTNTNLAERASEGGILAKVKLSRSCAGPLADVL
jgi:hypothetical protein